MNISFQNVAKVSALLTVTVEKADYQEKVNKALKSLRQKIDMPGFRKGMVPMSLIQKRFGKGALEEELNNIVSQGVNNYLKENNIHTLGQPVGNAQQPELDFDVMENFTFMIDVALAPEINVEMGTQDTIDYYNIDVTDEMVQAQVDMYASRNGKYQQVDDYQAGDMLKGKLTELDGNGAEKENGICLEEAVMLPMYMKNDEQKTRFEGKHKDDIVVINPYAAWDGNAAELASLLKIEKELAAEMKSDFNFRITELTRHIPGELNQELFDQALGKDVVTNEADFRAHIKEMLRKQHEEESDVKFMIDLHSYLMEKVGKPEYAEDILRRYMDTTSKKENPVSDEEFRKNLDSITWYLIREKLLAANDIKVADEDVLKMAKEVTRNQFAQYGMLTVPDELLEKYAHEMLRKEETVDSLVDRAINEKIGQAVKKQVTLNMHTVTVAEFNKLFE